MGQKEVHLFPCTVVLCHTGQNEVWFRERFISSPLRPCITWIRDQRSIPVTVLPGTTLVLMTPSASPFVRSGAFRFLEPYRYLLLSSLSTVLHPESSKMFSRDNQGCRKSRGRCWHRTSAFELSSTRPEGIW